MSEHKNNHSFAGRFAKKKADGFENKDSEGSRSGFAGKYSSDNTKERILGSKDKISELAKQAPVAPDAFSESGGIKSKSRTLNNRSFADATRRSRADLVYLVRGKDRGKPAWHYVLIDKDKKEMFLAKSRTGAMDVADYGEILYSGWGEDPPQEIKDKITEEFG